MKQKKNGGSVILYDLTTNDIHNLFKCQIKMRIVSATNTLDIGNRMCSGTKQCVFVNGKLIGYGELAALVTEMLKTTVTIEIDSKIADEKARLLQIASSLRPEIVNNCICVDYNQGTFYVETPSKNGRPQELYYFEETNTLYLFSDSFPTLDETSTYSCIEDILC